MRTLPAMPLSINWFDAWLRVFCYIRSISSTSFLLFLLLHIHRRFYCWKPWYELTLYQQKGMKKEKIKILVVEDSILIKERLKDMLLELDKVNQVLEAGTYEEAFRMLEQGMAHVLLLDLGLPGKSGIDLLRAIGQHKWELSIIVLTNQASNYYKNLCLSMGAHHFLDKTKDFEKVPLLVEGL